ncbi:MAG: T9SS type A sorting domain-containing protein [Fibrobacterota bacterium]
MPSKLRAIFLIILFLALPFCLYAQNILSLSSFESSQMQAWGWTGNPPGGSINGIDTICQGDVTDGVWALGRSFSAYSVATYLVSSSFPTNQNLFYSGSSLVFSTYRHFQQWFPTNWSGYDRLRVDIKSVTDSCLVLVMLSDPLSSPVITRQYSVPAGNWVTLEYNLAAANAQVNIPLSSGNIAKWGVDTLKVRRLNLGNMANMFISVIHFYGNREQKLLLDNMRLLQPGATDPSALPVLTDNSPFCDIQELPYSTPTWTAPYSGTLFQQKLDTVRIDSHNVWYFNPTANLFVANPYAIHAADDNNMVVDLGCARVIKTGDGGKTWTNLLNKKNLASDVSHESGAMARSAMGSGAGPDLMSVYVGQCAGEASPTAMFFRYLKFNGTSWDKCAPAMFTPNSYHCPEVMVNMIRLDNGRIWVADNETGFNGQFWLRASYSDDDGATWRTSDASLLKDVEKERTYGVRQGYNVGVPAWIDNSPAWSFNSASCLGTISSSINRTRPLLVHYKGSVGCLFADNSEFLRFSYFENGQWSTPVRILDASGSVPFAALTAGSTDDTVYITDNNNRVYRYVSGANAQDITPPGGQGRVLSLSGNKLVDIWQERVDSGTSWYYSINYTIYDLTNKTWGPIQALSHEPGMCQLTTDMFAPPNFVPIAWAYNLYGTPSYLNWIKVAKIPTADSGFIKVERSRGKAVKFELLQSYPNPASAATTVAFILESPRKMELRLYSLNGKLLSTLASGTYGKGKHRILCPFDSRIPAGVYCLRLESGKYAETKNVIVMR